MQEYYKQFENCRQHEIPSCQSVCPFNVDILDFQEKMAKNRYNIAYRTFRNSVGFPDIVAALCPQYCADKCPRKELDSPVMINLLEKTCVARAERKEATAYNVPPKEKRTAIVGGGISGLACALKLCGKKYPVTIFEKEDRLGGQLWDVLPPEVFLEDIERQFKLENYELFLNREIKDIDELKAQGFDAVYVATGSEGQDFGALHGEDGHCFISGDMAVFAGGSLTGKDLVHAIADGLYMAWTIEVYFKTGRLEYHDLSRQTQLIVDEERFEKSDHVEPTSNGIFTDEEASREAGRCMRCQCDACRSYCHLSEFLKKWPLQMRDEIMTTTMSSSSMIHKTPAIRLINMCTHCELCDSGCQGGIELGKMIKQARYKLHNIGKMPGAFHQFWIRDMEFANSDYASIVSAAPGHDTCSYAFFPGCHLGAADPRYVTDSYKWLLSKHEDTGLLLRCCGVPADWAGNEKMLEGEINSMREQWQSLGKPTLVCACPSCMRHINTHLPEIKMITLYELLEKEGVDMMAEREGKGCKDGKDEIYSVFDPCSAKGMSDAQDAVRNLVQRADIKLKELPKNKKGACCGFGGHPMIANPEYARFIAKKCGEFADNPYIVYCINCRDVFRQEEKPVRHILDVVFGIDEEQKEPPGINLRRENRVNLKETLLKEVWNKKMEQKPAECEYELIISPEVQDKMNRLKLLVEDVCEVIELSLKKGRRAADQTGLFTCYKELGAITCWVQYRIVNDAFEIVNVYTHRMKIELEAVWNGRKTNLDL